MSGNSFWNRIDLHQHTNHDIDCNGTLVQSNYSHLDYFKWLEQQNVKIKAVTCHNNIDLAEQIKQAIVSDFLGINHLVGVEIDYCFDELEFHAITILSPNVDIIKFANKLNEIRTSKGNNVFFNKEDFSKLHTEIEFIFIPHAIKDKGIFEKSVGDLEVSTIDWVVKSLISGMSEPILFENTRDYHIYSVAEKISRTLRRTDVTYEKLPSYVGTDYKFDNDEDRKNKILEKPQYSIFSQPTYRGLEIAIRNHRTRLSLDEQIINREKYIYEIKVKGQNEFEESTIKLSPGLNVIIGDSGSGKTLLLNQIFFQIKNRALKAAMKDPKAKEDENPYKSKVGKVDLLEIKFDKNYAFEDISVLEIPNIYSEILKTQENDSSLPAMFGIDNTNSANQVILDYKKKVSSYQDNLDMQDLYKNNGSKNYLNVSTAIEFMVKNKIEKTLFNLEIKFYDETNLNKVKTKIEKIEKYISNEEKIKEYFINMKPLLSDTEAKKLVDELIEKYSAVIEKLQEEWVNTQVVQNKLLFEQKLYEMINENIKKSIDMLGNKEKVFSERKTIATKELNSLIQNIKGLIKSEIEELNFDLSFPYSELKIEIEKNCNSYARISLNDDRFKIKEVDILENPLFNMSNIKTKIKGLALEIVNFNDSTEVKKLTSILNKNEINLSSIINEIEQIPKNVEIYLSETDEWKLIQNTNKGDIAKKSIEYYFNELVKTAQPNIILIDQPENDVDKSFITSTLSNFIKDKKSDKQIIVTSHDAIIAINSDVNKIIEATINKNNKFEYISYDLEYVRDKVLEATNRVSKILDGGKDNIKKRYQIYGGELNYENTII